LLLPLVENAIKHGARTTRERMQLVIRAFSEGTPADTAPEALPETVVIEIMNSGEWLPPDPFRPGSTGIGLENLQQRLRRYYPNAHAFTTEAKDGWVTVRVRLAPAGLRTSPATQARETATTL
jgi:LytS/YehU family sensor histidine kinase